jgi:LacI family repressor for deo operon, udp, cdd, tsx, nupC, and nupG
MMVLAVIPNLANPVFAQIVRGIDDELTHSGYGLVIGNLDNCDERQERYVDLVLSRQFDGVLLMNGSIPGVGKRSIGKARVPLVAMCAAIPDVKIPTVVVQDREAGRTAAEHLVRLGHTRLGYVSGPIGNIIDSERYTGFLEGLFEAGLSERDFIRWNGRFNFLAGVTAAESFLRMTLRPTGVFATCDESAIGFIKTVRAAGLRVPGDVSVIGFDGIEFADYIEPALTTFKQPLYELGRTGASILVRAISKELQPTDWNVRLPVTLLDRKTTGIALGVDARSAQRLS